MLFMSFDRLKALSRFLGMSNSLAEFVPRLSELAAPLRVLLKQDVIWEWNSQHDKSFQDMKSIISEHQTLR